MGLRKYKLGEYIERSTANNHSLKYKEDLKYKELKMMIYDLREYIVELEKKLDTLIYKSKID